MEVDYEIEIIQMSLTAMLWFFLFYRVILSFKERFFAFIIKYIEISVKFAMEHWIYESSSSRSVTSDPLISINIHVYLLFHVTG